jgi:hypothetical protein
MGALDVHWSARMAERLLECARLGTMQDEVSHRVAVLRIVLGVVGAKRLEEVHDPLEARHASQKSRCTRLKRFRTGTRRSAFASAIDSPTPPKRSRLGILRVTARVRGDTGRAKDVVC